MPRKKFDRIKKGDIIKADWLNKLAMEVERLSNITVSPPLSLMDDAGGLSFRVKSSSKRYHSHQAKTLQAMDPGETADVALYIEETSIDESVEATVCPTIQEVIPTNTWIRLNWTPTEDGVGRWEIVGYDCS